MKASCCTFPKGLSIWIKFANIRLARPVALLISDPLKHPEATLLSVPRFSNLFFQSINRLTAYRPSTRGRSVHTGSHICT